MMNIGVNMQAKYMKCSQEKANKLLLAYLNIQNLHDLFRANEISEEYYIEQLNKQFKIKKTLSE